MDIVGLEDINLLEKQLDNLTCDSPNTPNSPKVNEVGNADDEDGKANNVDLDECGSSVKDAFVNCLVEKDLAEYKIVTLNQIIVHARKKRHAVEDELKGIKARLKDLKEAVKEVTPNKKKARK